MNGGGEKGEQALLASWTTINSRGWCFECTGEQWTIEGFGVFKKRLWGCKIISLEPFVPECSKEGKIKVRRDTASHPARREMPRNIKEDKRPTKSVSFIIHAANFSRRYAAATLLHYLENPWIILIRPRFLPRNLARFATPSVRIPRSCGLVSFFKCFHLKICQCTITREKRNIRNGETNGVTKGERYGSKFDGYICDLIISRMVDGIIGIHRWASIDGWLSRLLI